MAAVNVNIVRPAGETSKVEQRDHAREKANCVRLRRAQFKRDVKAGQDTVIGRLLSTPDWLKTAKVFDVLRAEPGYGSARATRAMHHVDIGQGKTVAALTPRQRHDLILLLRGYTVPNARIEHLTGQRAERHAPRATDFEMRVLHLVVLEMSAITPENHAAAARALNTTPDALTRARSSLQRKGLLSPLGRPTDTGRARVTSPSSNPLVTA